MRWVELKVGAFEDLREARMQPLDQIAIYSLAGFNIIVYGLLIFSVVRRRYFSKPEISNTIEAFQLLEMALRERFPELPAGFTWGDAMSRLKQMNLDIDWGRLEIAMNDYESYRYGGSRQSSTDPREVLRLADRLGKGAKFVARA
jgi:hypothetical protein